MTPAKVEKVLAGILNRGNYQCWTDDLMTRVHKKDVVAIMLFEGESPERVQRHLSTEFEVVRSESCPSGRLIYVAEKTS